MNGLSFSQFMERFNDDNACADHLFNLRWPSGFLCPRCGHDDYYFIHKRELYQCKACKHQASLTAGTIFHRHHVGLKNGSLPFILFRPTSVATRRLASKGILVEVTIRRGSCSIRSGPLWLTGTTNINYLGTSNLMKPFSVAPMVSRDAAPKNLRSMLPSLLMKKVTRCMQRCKRLTS